MIVYSGTVKSFHRDVSNGIVANKLDKLFSDLRLGRESIQEFNSWKASLPRIGLIVSDRRIADDVQVALEYQIPCTSKRVDFMIGGSDGQKDNVVIVELKQWEKCDKTEKENVVYTYTGNAYREVAHPSQQAYSYAKLIEGLNQDVRINDIGLIPCAYLHNYKEEYRNMISNPFYSDAIKDAPLFLQEDGTKLSDFICKYVTKPSKKNLFEIIEHGKIKPSKALQDTVGSVLNGNKEFEMIDEQQVAYATVLNLVQNTINDDKKHTIIVRGGPGTGKSVIAINLLGTIINKLEKACLYVSKNSAPRAAFSNSLIRDRHAAGFLKGLFKGSGSFVETEQNTFDCIIVDEAHRLNLKSGMYGNLGENQIKEIINAAKISVFFIDEDQIISMKDIGRVDEIKKQATSLESVIHEGNDLILTSQFRCNGSDGYIAFIDDLLEIRSTANKEGFDIDYEIKVFDNPCEMREALRIKNTNNKARMIAGYCYPWNSKKDKTKMDIELPNGFKAQWNFKRDGFAIDPNSFEQVGCIHSTQGLEFDYVGIIIGKDLIYRNGRVETDYSARAKNDKTIVSVNSEAKRRLADTIIRNTYKTLLTRGQKGCYVYCQDEELRDYLLGRLSAANRK